MTVALVDFVPKSYAKCIFVVESDRNLGKSLQNARPWLNFIVAIGPEK
jgi:hypothetical protein